MPDKITYACPELACKHKITLWADHSMSDLEDGMRRHYEKEHPDDETP